MAGCRGVRDAPFRLIVSAFDKSQFKPFSVAKGAVFSWVENSLPSPQQIVAVRVNDAGDSQLPSTTGSIKTGSSLTSRLTSARSTKGYLAFVWQDTVSGGNAILKAQNLSVDGRLGYWLFTDGVD
ncbi:MAG: hypothetical protein ABI650_10180 [Dokdonella sp.]